ncbi:hypothetical protein [Streptomyces collinus]|uniref:hypothetical protein n=1 Tax=Streptomyces collinus TaxID=42684 RepID=UPI0037D1EAEA
MSQLDLGKQFSWASEQADRPQRKWWPQRELPDQLDPYTHTAITGIAEGRTYSELGW